MFHANKSNHDHAISPVIGTILMVAATVIIAGAVYAAVSAYSGHNSKPPVDASWKAQALDTDGNGLDDTIKVTYLGGPTNVATTAMSMSMSQSNGTALAAGAASHSVGGQWNPGDYATYTLQYGPGASGAATIYATITQGGNTVLDQQIQLRQ
ncbi:MAG: Archaeal Type pilin, N-terminal [Thermoplasmata archaeon]|jgi:flagellin-like protein|nr:Archaeal Type pilin, N-terminal [Thermoplasmata archaeon]